MAVTLTDSENDFAFSVDEIAAGKRLDQVLQQQFPGWSRRRIARAMDEGAVRVNGRPARKGGRAVAGARITLLRPPDLPSLLSPTPENEPCDVVYEDHDLVALCKPAGMPTHPLRAGELGTLANRVIARFPECGQASSDVREAGIVHRLDILTSGLVLVARHAEVYARLREAFRNEQVEKEYLALVVGRAESTIVQSPTGSWAETAVEPIELLGDSTTLVRCRTHTGRRHQVRQHLASIGHPIVGDVQYGGPPRPHELVGFFLHAERLLFTHPNRKEPLELSAPLPPDRLAALTRMRPTE